MFSYSIQMQQQQIVLFSVTKPKTYTKSHSVWKQNFYIVQPHKQTQMKRTVQNVCTSQNTGVNTGAFSGST